MEIINSFFNNIKDKLTNPYFGTLISVLIIHHWELIFSVFNFDKDCNLQDKLYLIEEYLLKNITLKTFLLDCLIAMIYMLLGYLIIILTRSIVLFIEYWLMPFVTGKIINKNVVQKTEYDNVIREREEYFDQYEEQRKNVRNFSKTIDEQIEQIKQKDKNIIEQNKSINEISKNLDFTEKEVKSYEEINRNDKQKIIELQTNINTLERENNNYSTKVNGYNHLFFDKQNQSFYSSVDKFPPEIINKLKELKNDDKWKAFISVGYFFEKGGGIGGELLSEMIKRDLAFERNKRDDLTPIGKIIYNYRSLFDKNL